MTLKNIMIVGVGGQGTLLASHMFGELATGADYGTKLSEIRGMAQYGGSMVTFVRYGEKVAEPIVGKNQADVLIAFEHPEVLWYLHFLKKDGIIIVSNRHIDPTTVTAGVAEYPEGITNRLKETHRTIIMEVVEEAKRMDAPKAFNIIVLGATTRHTGLEKEDWLKVIRTTVPPKTVGINKKAFETDYALSV